MFWDLLDDLMDFTPDHAKPTSSQSWLGRVATRLVQLVTLAAIVFILYLTFFTTPAP